MTTKLACYIKQERVKQGLNYAQVSRKMGYKNLNKGIRRIIDLEREDVVHPEVLDRIIDALELDKDKVKYLVQLDEEEQQRKFDEWVNTPIKWHLIIRWMPAVYGEREIPGYIKTQDEAIDYAREVAKELKSMVWLVLSRKENIHIYPDGSVRSRNEVTMDNSWLPFTRIK